MAFPHYDNTIHALRVHLQLRSRAWRGHRRGVQPHSFTLGRAPEKFRKGVYQQRGTYTCYFSAATFCHLTPKLL
jgi:hypothetical protein